VVVCIQGVFQQSIEPACLANQDNPSVDVLSLSLSLCVCVVCVSLCVCVCVSWAYVDKTSLLGARHQRVTWARDPCHPEHASAHCPGRHKRPALSALSIGP
jgi:hypothetical protein